MPYNLRGREPRPNRLEVRLSNSELERLDNACAALDKPASVIVRLAIDRFVDSLDQDETTDHSYTRGVKGYRPAP